MTNIISIILHNFNLEYCLFRLIKKKSPVWKQLKVTTFMRQTDLSSLLGGRVRAAHNVQPPGPTPSRVDGFRGIGTVVRAPPSGTTTPGRRQSVNSRK